MARKKSGINYNKGFKRIYFVIAGLWIAFITFAYVAEFSFCVIHGDKISVTGSTNAESIECMGFSIKRIIVQWLFFSGLVIPVYYFINWIVSGFKK